MSGKARQNILIVSDRTRAIRLVQETVARRAIRGVVVSGAKAGDEALHGEAWDMVLVDLETLGPRACLI